MAVPAGWPGLGIEIAFKTRICCFQLTPWDSPRVHKEGGGPHESHHAVVHRGRLASLQRVALCMFVVCTWDVRRRSGKAWCRDLVLWTRCPCSAPPVCISMRECVHARAIDLDGRGATMPALADGRGATMPALARRCDERDLDAMSACSAGSWFNTVDKAWCRGGLVTSDSRTTWPHCTVTHLAPRHVLAQHQLAPADQRHEVIITRRYIGSMRSSAPRTPRRKTSSCMHSSCHRSNRGTTHANDDRSPTSGKSGATERVEGRSDSQRNNWWQQQSHQVG